MTARSVSEAARELGLSKTTLRRRLGLAPRGAYPEASWAPKSQGRSAQPVLLADVPGLDDRLSRMEKNLIRILLWADKHSESIEKVLDLLSRAEDEEPL